MVKLYATHGFASDQQASDYLNGEVSRTYLRDIRNGRVPSLDTLNVLTQAFPDSATDLLQLSGFVVPEDPQAYEWRAIRQAAEYAAEKSGVPAERIVRDAMERYGIEVPEGDAVSEAEG